MAKILIIYFLFIYFLFSSRFSDNLKEIEFDGKAIIYDHKNNIFEYYPSEFNDKVPIASITKNINAVFVLWLAQKGILNLESDIRNQYHLLAKMPNEITIHDLLIHSSGISETSIHTGNSQEFYPGLEYDYEGLNYSILRSIIELKGINYESKFSEFLNEFGVKDIGIINDPSEYNIDEKNFLKGSSDLFAKPKELLILLSKIQNNNILNKESKNILKKVNFTLKDSTKKTMYGDLFESNYGIKFFFMRGTTTNKEILCVLNDNRHNYFYLESNGETDLYKVFEKTLNNATDDSIELPETKKDPNFLVLIIPTILVVTLILILFRKKK